MPALTNPRRETYAQLVAAGSQKIEAFKKAGYRPDRSAASKMAQEPEVAKRIAEIVADRHAIARKATEKAVERAAVTEEWIITRLKYNAEAALRGQPELDKDGVQTGRFVGKPDRAAANRALELLGKTKGMFIDRHEFGAPGAFAAMSDDELSAKIADMGAQLGIPPKALQAVAGGPTKH
jgi:phage terminase small subunit